MCSVPSSRVAPKTIMAARCLSCREIRPPGIRCITYATPAVVDFVDDSEAYENASAFLAEFHSVTVATATSFRAPSERLDVIEEVPRTEAEECDLGLSIPILMRRSSVNSGLSRQKAVSSCLSSMAEEVVDNADAPEWKKKQKMKFPVQTKIREKSSSRTLRWKI